MRRFLREAWELWYWAMFCPSQLQERMNTWGQSSKVPVNSFTILLANPNLRFISQYLLVVGFFCLPLLYLICSSGKFINALLLFIAILVAYGTSLWSLSLGIHWPLLFALIYEPNITFYGLALQKVSGILPPFSQPILGFGVGTLGLCLSGAVTTWLIIYKHLSTTRTFFIVAGGLSIGAGSWLATQNGAVFLAIVVATVLSLFLFEGTLKTSDDEAIVAGTVGDFIVRVAEIGAAIGVAGSVAGVVAGTVGIRIAVGVMVGVAAGVGAGVGFAGSVAGGFVGVAGGFAVIFAVIFSAVYAAVFSGIVVGVLEGVTSLSVAGLAIAYGLVSFSLAPLAQRWLGIGLIGVFVLLGVEHLGATTMVTVPIVFAFYYRILPDYLVASGLAVFFAFSNWGSRQFRFRAIRQLTLRSEAFLRWLPPHTTEILWLHLPYHNDILATAFTRNPDLTWSTIQKMQSLETPGFKSTVELALPQIVATQFNAVSTIPEILYTANPAHPWLPRLIPSFYLAASGQNSPASFTQLPQELSILLPLILDTLQDIEAALQAGNSALRDRGLARIEKNLLGLSNRLPGLGLRPPAVRRWQPVITRWWHILRQETQGKVQRELLNPFQYGNPLRPSRNHIFKGRKAFADRIIRLILDRNRPTLMLYGPRRCGKSSFLLNLPRLLPSDLVPIFLDLQSAATTTDDAGFCQGLVRAIHRDSRSQGILMPDVPSRPDFQSSPYITLETWLDEALSTLGDHRRLLLNLDEFEKIGSAITAGKLTENLFDELRHLIQHHDRLGFLFSGVQTLDEIGPNWSSYFISIVPMEMLYLEPAEAQDLLTNPDPDFALRYDPGIVDEILTLTRCQPYLLQLIGSALVTQANQQQTQLVTSDLLQTAIQNALTLGEPYFTNVWTEFTGTTDAERTAGQTLLLALAKKYPLNTIDDEPNRKSRQRLLRFHVIEQTSKGDQIEIPLVEQWVKERAVLP